MSAATHKRKSKQKEKAPFSIPNKLVSLIFALLALLLYGRSLRYDYTFDDDIFTRRNVVTDAGLQRFGEIWSKGSVYGFSGENAGIYRPVTLSAFALERSIFGSFDPTVSHAIHLLLFALGIALLHRWMLAIRGPGTGWIVLGVPLLFLLHPVHVDVIGSIKSRDELLVLLGIAGAGIALFNYADRRNPRALAIAGFLFFFACLSKEHALTFAAVFPMMLWVLRPGLSVRDLLRINLPIWGAALLYLLLRFWILDPSTAHPIADPLINNALAAAASPLERIATILFIQGKYLLLIFWPQHLSYDYSFAHVTVHGFGDWQVWLAAVASIGLLALGILGTIRRQLWGMGILLYFIVLLPVSQVFMEIGATMAERFLFLPSLGLMIASVAAMQKLSAPDAPVERRKIISALAGLALLLLLHRSVTRLPVWQDNSSLFEQGVNDAPRSFRTHFNLAELQRLRAESMGNAQRAGQLFKRSIIHYQKSLEIYPRQPMAWYSLGVCLYTIDRKKMAKNAYEECVKLEPRHAMAWNNLGVILFEQKDYPAAISYFEKAIEANPEFADPLANLGAAYHNMGDRELAIHYYRQALEINPNQPNAKKNLEMLGE